MVTTTTSRKKQDPGEARTLALFGLLLVTVIVLWISLNKKVNQENEKEEVSGLSADTGYVPDK